MIYLADLTKNYKLKKPTTRDFVNVTDLNDNYNEIDLQMKTIDEKTENISSQLGEKLNIGADYRPNLLINGDFKINQRGRSSYTLYNAYTVDRWKHIGSFLAVTPTSTGVNLACTCNTNENLIYQDIDDYTRFVGKTVTVSMKYKNLSLGTNTSVALNINDGVGGKFYSLTPTSPSNGIVSVTFTIASSPIRLYINLSKYGTGSAFSIDIDYIKLEVNDHATPFIPRSYAEELRDCQRYYEKCTNWQRVSNFTGSAKVIGDFLTVPFKVTKRCNPTVIFNYDLADGVATNATSSTSYLDGFTDNTIQIPNTYFLDINSWTADAEL